jgi:hypothetical protein
MNKRAKRLIVLEDAVAKNGQATKFSSFSNKDGATYKSYSFPNSGSNNSNDKDDPS